MLLLEPLVRGVVVPAFVCALLLCLAWRPWRRDAGPGGGAWLEPFAFAAGYLAGHAATVGTPSLVPLDSREAFFHLAFLASLLAPASRESKLPTLIRGGSSILLALGVPLLIFRTRIANVWSPGGSALRVLAFGAASLAVASMCGRIARLPGPLSFLTLIIPTTAASALLLICGNAALSQLAGAVTTCLGVALLLSLATSKRGLSEASAILVGTLFFALSVSRAVFGEVPIASAVLLCLSPFATFLSARSSRLEGAPPGKVAVVVVGASLLPALVAILIAT